MITSLKLTENPNSYLKCNGRSGKISQARPAANKCFSKFFFKNLLTFNVNVLYYNCQGDRVKPSSKNKRMSANDFFKKNEKPLDTHTENCYNKDVNRQRTERRNTNEIR